MIGLSLLSYWVSNLRFCMGNRAVCSACSAPLACKIGYCPLSHNWWVPSRHLILEGRSEHIPFVPVEQSICVSRERLLARCIAILFKATVYWKMAAELSYDACKTRVICVNRYGGSYAPRCGVKRSCELDDREGHISFGSRSVPSEVDTCNGSVLDMMAPGPTMIQQLRFLRPVNLRLSTYSDRMMRGLEAKLSPSPSASSRDSDAQSALSWDFRTPVVHATREEQEMSEQKELGEYSMKSI